MNLKNLFVYPKLPDNLSKLQSLAYNLWCTWNYEAISLFYRIDAQLFRAVNHNPIQFLVNLPSKRIDQLAQDRGFLFELERVWAAVSGISAIRQPLPDRHRRGPGADRRHSLFRDGVRAARVHSDLQRRPRRLVRGLSQGVFRPESAGRGPRPGLQVRLLHPAHQHQRRAGGAVRRIRQSSCPPARGARSRGRQGLYRSVDPRPAGQGQALADRRGQDPAPDARYGPSGEPAPSARHHA